ncbi:TonB-dependent receptor [Dasania marina]|uniref:TonB-dependent receptor n=1 Tax=Dasania marina TaxID=471499 RepID=UPI00036255F4|nr:TonB-dependent receptor [Dasania marina]
MTFVANAQQYKKLSTVKTLLMGGAVSMLAASVQAAGLEEVMVTAQKKSQSAQDVGIAITAFGGEAMKSMGMTQPIDMAPQTPGLTIKNVLNKAAPIFTVRGVGNTAFTSNSVAPVGVYVDELFLPSSSMLTFSLFDMERVEVLKGPQGTLFGRNTTAGAVAFISEKPRQEFSANVSTTLGDYGLRNVEGAIGGGLTETLSGRLAVKWDYQDEGFFTNKINGRNDDIGSTDTLALRGALRWEFDNTDINWNVHGGRDRSENEPWVAIGRRDPNTVTGNKPELPGPNGGDVFTNSCADPATTNIKYFIKNCSNNLGYRDPYEDLRVGEFSQVPSLESDSLGTLLNITVDMGASTLTSISAYETKDSYIEEDFDGGPFRVGDTSYANDISVFSQEVRLSSNEPAFDKMDWIVGGMVYQDSMDVADTYGYTDRVNHDVLVEFTQDTTSWALFAHTETQLDEEWNFIAALRYTEDKIAFDGGTYMVNREPDFTGDATFFSSAPILEDDEIETTEVTGKLGLEYAPNDDLLIYASYSRGYKAGVWNGFWATVAGDHVATDPEYIDAYELGFKSTLLDNSLQFNGSVYLYDYTDMQLFADLPDGRFAIFNAGSADIMGAEADVWWRPLDGLDIKAGVAYNDAKVSAKVGLLDFDDATPPNTPELTYNALVRYEWNVSDSLLASVQTDFAYQDGVFFSLDNLKATSQEDYTLVNLRAGVASADDVWSAYVWVKNATDKDYFTENLSSGSAGALSGQVGPPRTVGITLSYNWE